MTVTNKFSRRSILTAGAGMAATAMAELTPATRMGPEPEIPIRRINGDVHLHRNLN